LGESSVIIRYSEREIAMQKSRREDISYVTSPRGYVVAALVVEA
jgi:hypothetical protein